MAKAPSLGVSEAAAEILFTTSPSDALGHAEAYIYKAIATIDTGQTTWQTSVQGPIYVIEAAVAEGVMDNNVLAQTTTMFYGEALVDDVVGLFNWKSNEIIQITYL